MDQKFIDKIDDFGWTFHSFRYVMTPTDPIWRFECKRCEINFEISNLNILLDASFDYTDCCICKLIWKGTG
jgi:hypothetical protein